MSSFADQRKPCRVPNGSDKAIDGYCEELPDKVLVHPCVGPPCQVAKGKAEILERNRCNKGPPKPRAANQSEKFRELVTANLAPNMLTGSKTSMFAGIKIVVNIEESNGIDFSKLAKANIPKEYASSVPSEVVFNFKSISDEPTVFVRFPNREDYYKAANVESLSWENCLDQKAEIGKKVD